MTVKARQEKIRAQVNTLQLPDKNKQLNRTAIVSPQSYSTSLCEEKNQSSDNLVSEIAGVCFEKDSEKIAVQPIFRPRLLLSIPSTPTYKSESYSVLVMATRTSFQGPSTISPHPEIAVPAVQVSHTNSRVWVHPRMEEMDRWLQVEANLKAMEFIPRARDIVPHTFNEWVAHRRGRLQDAQVEESKRLADIQTSSRRRHSGLPPLGPRVRVGPAFGGKRFNDGRSAVLALPTVFSPWNAPTPERPQALWPCKEEMQEEGDERHTSGFGRFLGLPRVPGNETVTWKQKQVLRASVFDEVWKLPTTASVAAAKVRAEAEETERMEELLGVSLIEAIDCR